MTNHGLSEEAARDGDIWRNVGEGKSLYSAQILDDDDDEMFCTMERFVICTHPQISLGRLSEGE
jgi:hypothetical protein